MRLPDLVILNGGTTSEAIDILHIGEASIYAPAALTAVVNVQISPNGTDWYSTQTIAVNALEIIEQLNARFIRVLSAGAEGAERRFPMHGRP